MYADNLILQNSCPGTSIFFQRFLNDCVSLDDKSKFVTDRVCVKRAVRHNPAVRILLLPGIGHLPRLFLGKCGELRYASLIKTFAQRRISLGFQTDSAAGSRDQDLSLPVGDHQVFQFQPVVQFLQIILRQHKIRIILHEIFQQVKILFIKFPETLPGTQIDLMPGQKDLLQIFGVLRHLLPDILHRIANLNAFQKNAEQDNTDHAEQDSENTPGFNAGCSFG